MNLAVWIGLGMGARGPGAVSHLHLLVALLRRILFVALIAKMHVSVAQISRWLAAIPTLPPEIAGVLGGLSTDALGLGSTGRTEFLFWRGIGTGTGTGTGPVACSLERIGALDHATIERLATAAVAAAVESVLSHDLSVEGFMGWFLSFAARSLLALSEHFSLYLVSQTVFLDERIHLGTKLVRCSEQIIGQLVRMILCPDDTRTQGALKGIEQDPLVVIPCCFVVAGLDLGNDALSVITVPAVESDDPFGFGFGCGCGCGFQWIETDSADFGAVLLEVVGGCHGWC